MIIYGTGEKKLKTNQNQLLNCPNCGAKALGFHLFIKYAHIFWIPLFPFKRRNVAHCTECDVIYEDKRIPETLTYDLSDAKSITRVPFYLFSGLILLVIAIGFIIIQESGPKTYKYPSGNKEARGKLVNDTMVGKWEFWHENGNLECIQYYNDRGREDSVWTWWREDGSIEKTGGFKNGLYSGAWIYYDSLEKISAKEIYKENRLNGYAEYFSDNEILQAEGYYERDYPEGKWVYYYETGQVMDSGFYKNRDKVGTWYSYYKDGSNKNTLVYKGDDFKIINYWTEDGDQVVKNGTGFYTTYHENGQKESYGKVKDGNLVGTWNFWYDNGALKETGKYRGDEYCLLTYLDKYGTKLISNGNGYFKIISNDITTQEGKYQNGLKQEEWKTRNESDIITSKVQYKNGKANGKAFFYYDTGELHSEGSLIDDKKDGLWTWYFSNGQKESEVEYKDEEKSGIQLFWNERGVLVKKEHYKNGNLVNEELL